MPPAFGDCDTLCFGQAAMHWLGMLDILSLVYR